MLRAILAVIAGYAVMFLFVFITFTIAMYVMGVDRTYKAGTWDVSSTWLSVSFLLGCIAAILGGLTCGAIARSKTPPKVLATLVFVLGALMAIPAVFMHNEATNVPARTSDVSPFDAMQYSKTPPVALILNPIIGAVGVLIGAALIKRSPTSHPTMV